MEQENYNKSEEMIRYEKETGKKSIWRGNVTKEFEKWQKGDKVYTREGVRWTLYIDSELDKKWKDFLFKMKLKSPNYSMTQLGKDSINLFVELIEHIQKINSKFDYNYESLQEIACKISLLSFEKTKTEIYQDFIQSMTPLKLFFLLIKRNINDPNELSKLLENTEATIKELNDKIQIYLQEPSLKRFLKHYDVLYAEDDKNMREAIEFFFKMNNFTINSVENAEQALNVLKDFTPKLIIIDIGLPGKIKGDELCKMLKLKDEFKKIPIVLFTAKIIEDEIEKIKKETLADGIFLKSRVNSFTDLNELFEYLTKQM